MWGADAGLKTARVRGGLEYSGEEKVRRVARNRKRNCPRPASLVGLVHILIPSETTEYRLPQHPDERMPVVLASPGVGEAFARHHAQPKPEF